MPERKPPPKPAQRLGARRMVLLAVTLGALAIVAFALSRGGAKDKATLAQPTITPTAQSSCPPLPPRTKKPKWYPNDLPLPKGSYPVKATFGLTEQYEEATFAVKTTLQTFVQHVLSVWPKEGWTLGRGDAEPYEAEAPFFKRREDRFGAFRASASPCDPNTIIVYIVMGKLRAPGGNNPATPSPLVQPSG